MKTPVVPKPKKTDITFADAWKTFQKEFNKDQEPGSTYFGYQSNIAMYLWDNGVVKNLDKANKHAKALLKLMFDLKERNE